MVIRDSPGFPGTQYVEQASLELPQMLLPQCLSLLCAEITHVHQQSPLALSQCVNSSNGLLTLLWYLVMAVFK